MDKSCKQPDNKTRSLGTKIFYLFTVFIIVIYVSFSAFFVYYQSQMLKEHLAEEGRQLANLLADNLKLGVFAENDDLLRGPVESILEYDETILVQAFNNEGKQLISLAKKGAQIEQTEMSELEKQRSILESIRIKYAPLQLSGRESMEFWAPVKSGERFTEENLYYEYTVSPPKEYIIGFVRVVLTTSILKASLKQVLINSTFIPSLFIIPGWFIAYYIVIRITRPLKRLTQGVKAIGTDETFVNVQVETKDEIGRLATAFNEMALSLKNRDTENKELEEQLRQAQKMEAVGTLAGGIAHDFNNIISVIRGYGRMLQKNKDFEETTRNYVEQIVSSSNRAAALTRRLLTFGRKQIIDPKPVNINNVILNVETMLKRLVPENVQFILNLSETELIVTADTTHMEQVIMNLVSNSRDAMPEGGNITITTRLIAPEGPVFRPVSIDRDSKYAFISIEDTGTGIDKVIKEKIFDPFFTTKDVGEGSGLGLSIVYGIIKQHQGLVDVESTPGQGTKFNIFLPTNTSQVEDNDHIASILPNGTETILIAEDDEYVRALVSSVLKQNGYKVIEATDGNSAVAEFLANRDKVSLMLIDVFMPKKKGTAVFKEIRETRPDIKAIFISGHSTSHIINQFEFTEKISFLSKPILPDELLHKVRELLDKQ